MAEPLLLEWLTGGSFVKIIVTLLALGALTANAGSVLKPETAISEKILGGAILVIGQKGSLAIDGPTNKALEKDLGSTKVFFEDLILETPTDQVVQKYASQKSEAVQSVIQRYVQMMSPKEEIKN